MVSIINSCNTVDFYSAAERSTLATYFFFTYPSLTALKLLNLESFENNTPLKALLIV